MTSPTRICIDFNSNHLEHTIEYLNNHDYDENKIYILLTDHSEEDWILDFPFYVLPPFRTLEEFFPEFPFHHHAMIPTKKIQESPANVDSLESDTSKLTTFFLDNPVIRLVWIMTMIITTEDPGEKLN
jgi:hypothetical protein